MFTPPDASIAIRRRVVGLAGLLLAAAAVVAIRAAADAILPVSADGHYTLAASPGRWLISLKNYLPRTVPSAAALVLVAWAARVFARCTPSVRTANPGASTLSLSIYAVVWFLAFIVPVLPLVARSELYLYLPGFGFCLLAGHVADAALSGCPRRTIYATVGLYAVAAGAYLLQRNASIHDDLVFSRRFVETVATDPILASYKGAVLVVPANPVSDRALRDAIGGYVTPVLHYALNRTDVYGWASYADPAVESASALVLICESREGVPVLRRGN